MNVMTFKNTSERVLYFYIPSLTKTIERFKTLKVTLKTKVCFATFWTHGTLGRAWPCDRCLQLYVFCFSFLLY